MKKIGHYLPAIGWIGTYICILAVYNWLFYSNIGTFVGMAPKHTLLSQTYSMKEQCPLVGDDQQVAIYQKDGQFHAYCKSRTIASVGGHPLYPWANHIVLKDNPMIAMSDIALNEY